MLATAKRHLDIVAELVTDGFTYDLVFDCGAFETYFVATDDQSLILKFPTFYEVAHKHRDCHRADTTRDWSYFATLLQGELVKFHVSC